MQVHTKKRHISQKLRISPVVKKKFFEVKEKPMSVEEALHELCGDLPRWAIAFRGLRHREGLTQVEIGNMLGIPQGNISQIEHGIRSIGKQTAKRIAELFKTDYRLFL